MLGCRLVCSITLVLIGLFNTVAAEAQQGARVARIGYLGGNSADTFVREAFLQGLRELGYVEGRNVVFEFRFGEGKLDLPEPPLRLLHSEAILNTGKLDQFRRLSTTDLMDSLKPGRPGALKVRPDGTVLDGHHRLVVLRDRGVNVDDLPREVLAHEVRE